METPTGHALPESETRSQCDIILAQLKAQAGQWVSMTTLGMAAGCWAVHSRIADLRRKGHAILNRTVHVRYPKRKLSFYQLVNREEAKA